MKGMTVFEMLKEDERAKLLAEYKDKKIKKYNNIICTLMVFSSLLVVLLVLGIVLESRRVWITFTVLTVISAAIIIILYVFKKKFTEKAEDEEFLWDKYYDENPDVVSKMKTDGKITVFFKEKGLQPDKKFELGSDVLFAVDKDLTYFAVSKNGKVSFIKCNKILDYEIYENGAKTVSGTAGNAIVGGLLFGQLGAIAGASMKKEIVEEINELKIIIYIDDVKTPVFSLKIETESMEKSSRNYSLLMTKIKSVCSVLKIIINKNKKETRNITDSVKPEAYTTASEDKSIETQLEEIRRLYDKKIISEEEYQKKRKKILGIE